MTERDLEQRTLAPDDRPASEQPAWRREFPIDVPEDNYVARRDFTKFVGLTSLAFVVGQLWILLRSWFGAGRDETPRTPIAHLDEIPAGTSRTFAYPNAEEPCLLLRPDERTLVAYQQK